MNAEPFDGGLWTPRRCDRCGTRRGLHKVGTEQCPNAAWRPGNGKPQWMTHSTYAVYSGIPIKETVK